ncbi:PepSY-associated TM helix domain-containing protein [Rhizobacter sp. P5_C2]
MNHIASGSGARADAAARSSSLYRAVWRWHFYAGLLCLPFLVMMAITGALYLFRDEIDAIVYRDLLQVPAAASRALPPEALVANAVAAVPGSVRRYVPAAAAGRSAEVGIAGADGQRITVYLDPSTGAVLGHLRDDRKLMEVVKHIHSLVIAGTVANHGIEIVAGWTIVLVVTGTCLWWPRGRSGGVISVRGSPAKRLWWRDLHAVTGAFAAIAILFLAVTGMPWSAFWGHQFGALTNAWGIGLPAYVWSKAPPSTVPMAQQGEVPWTLGQATVPLSAAAPADPHAGHAGHGGGGPVPTATSGAIGLDAAIATFERLQLEPGYSVNLPNGPRGVYTAMLFPDDVTHERVIHLDQYSGRPLIDVGYADYGVAGKATEWGVSLHTGRQFGLVNQLVMLAGCLAIIALAVTSAVMWWKRRPGGQLAAPERKDGDRLARPVIAIAVVLGLLYPLLGASMLAALALDAALPRAWRARFAL